MKGLLRSKTEVPVNHEVGSTLFYVHICIPLVEVNFNRIHKVVFISSIRYKKHPELNMIRQTKAVAAAAILLCLGLTLVVIDSLSTLKLTSRRPYWNKLKGSRQCPVSRSNSNGVSASRLFGASDFSSHPYSVYYGTSGSTAQQNFGQNDDINDVYGYAPDVAEVETERFDSHKHGQNRNLQSMQAIPLFDGRRGATVFGRRYNDEGPHQFYQDPPMAHERDMMFHDEEFMEDPHVIEEMDSLMHEREHLRRKLDAVVSENIHLHNRNSMNGVAPQVTPPQGQNQFFQGTNSMLQQEAPQRQMRMGDNPSTRSVMDSVMEELKNMQRTVQAFEAQHYQGHGNGDTMNAPATPPSVESMKSELKNMEQVLQNLEQEKAQSSSFANGQDASTFGASETDYTNLNGSTPPISQEQQPVNGSISSVNGSKVSDHTSQLFDGEYEVVIKAELKKKNGFQATNDQVEKQIDVNKESPAESFSSNYI